MDLKKEFEKEKGFDCYAYRQDYAGGQQYKDGFNDDYVEWLENKVNSVNEYCLPNLSELQKRYDLNSAGGWDSHPDYCYLEGVKETYNAIEKEFTIFKAP